MLSTDRIEIHQSQPASMTKRRCEGHTSGCDWWISIRSVDNTLDWRKFWKRFRGCFVFQGAFHYAKLTGQRLFWIIPVRGKRNGPFHLNSDRNFRNLWHNAEASPKSRINPFHTNHMTTFLCHVTTSFGHHVISFLQPTVQNSNGRFTTLVILIVSITWRLRAVQITLKDSKESSLETRLAGNRLFLVRFNRRRL